MDKTVFSIAYSGSALDDGSMDIKDFAPALLSLGDLIEQANRIINKNESKIQVRVQSDFNRGSFEVTLEITRSIMEQLSFALGSEVSLSDLLALLGIAGAGIGVTLKGLLHLIKEIRGRKIEKAKQKDAGKVEIFFTDQSQTAITTNNIYNLYISTSVQEAARGVIKPLKNPGVDGFSVFASPAKVKDKSPSFTLAKEEACYFNPPAYVEETTEPEIIASNSYQGIYRLVTVQFEEGYKWCLSNGLDKITAILKDEDFIYKIENNLIAFSKDDVLFVDIRSTHWKNPDGTYKIENEITKVIEHIKKKEQLSIPFQTNPPRLKTDQSDD